MRELLKKETVFHWTPECTTELEDLKTALMSKPILGAIDDNSDIYITVDGSKLGLGGHIFQKRPNAKYILVLIIPVQRQKANIIGHLML